jgi:four helix bundle protein
MTRDIYLMTRASDFARDYGLCSQIQRASVSVMSNIAEGFERGSRGEFSHLLNVARASCAEVRSDLYVALDVGYLKEPSFGLHMAQAEEVARIVGGLRASVERGRKK